MVVQAIFFVFCEPPFETVGKHPHLGWARPCGLAALHKAKPGAFRQVVSDVWVGFALRVENFTLNQEIVHSHNASVLAAANQG